MQEEPSEETPRESIAKRVSAVLDRAEITYLRVLRGAILIIATGLIIYAAILATISIYRIAQSPDSVQEEPASVSANELAAISNSPETHQGPTRRDAVNPAHRRGYDQFLSHYYQLYRSRFETYRQAEDRPLTKAEFDSRFVDVQARLAAIGRGDVNFDNDKRDLDALLQAITDAAALPETRRRLQQYKSARKVEVCRNVERTRTSVTMGWDAYSMACSTWYENGGCAVPRTIQTPYTARECAMRFPEGTQSHLQIFRAYQDRFFSLLTERRATNAARAQSERDNIIVGIENGKMSLWTALLLGAAFLALMFFFLLIAIERHQRRLAADQVGDQSSG